MKIQLGIVACLLAGCVVQPTASAPTPQVAVAMAAPVVRGATLRIGVEYLAPEVAADGAAADTAPLPEVELVRDWPEPRTNRRSTPQPARSEPAERHTWTLSPAELAAIDDPIARETLHFVEDLVESDQRRARHEVRMPFFDWLQQEIDADPLLARKAADAVDREEWVHEHGPSLLQRPLRQLLLRLPVAQHFEVAVQDFRSDHVPLSEPYRQAHGDQEGLGRMSMRVHTNDFADPVELTYMRSGVRIGSSQEFGKLAIDLPLAPQLRVELRLRTVYETHDSNLRADLVYRPSARTSLHLSAGDDMDFLSTASAYSLFESPMDGSPGLLLYAVHIF